MFTVRLNINRYTNERIKKHFMNLEVGSVLKGKVTGIAKFGAFVTLAPNVSGLVHISEVSNTYVNNIEDYLTVGQEVTVKVISIDGNNRINLSIKQAQENSGERRERTAPNRPQRREQRQNSSNYKSSESAAASTAAPVEATVGKSGDQAFEESLKRFLQESDSKISESGRYDRQRSTRRNGRH